MKLTAKVELLTTPEQHAALLATLERANEACNYLSQLAWDTKTFRQFSLHKLGYYAVRERFGLSAQMAVRCEAKVADAYKLDRKTLRAFKPHGAIAYDSRILKWKLNTFSVSIWTLGGREEMLFSTGPKQLELLKFQRGESDLVYLRGKFYLLATCDIPEPTPEDVEGFLGVDFGIAQIATDSEGRTYSGSHIKSVRHRHRRLRTRLQRKGTKSAKRKLKKLSGKERRFAKDANHVVAKSIVATAKRNRQAIALEQLKGIRARVRARKPQRATLHSWAFSQLGGFIEYKARLAGVNVVYVDPRNTSRQCSECGYTDKANRPSQAVFRCCACGVSLNADHNAARNIASRGDIKRPNAGGVVSKSAHATSHLQAPPL